MKHVQYLTLMSLVTQIYRSISRAVGGQLDLKRIKTTRPPILRNLQVLLCAVMLCSLVVPGGTASETPKIANAQDLEAVNKRLQSTGDKIWSAADDEISTADMVALLAKWHQTKEQIISSAVRNGEISASDGDALRRSIVKDELSELQGFFEDQANRDASDDGDDDEWEELTEAQLKWRHGPKNNHIGVSLSAFEYAKMIESELGVPPVVDLRNSVEIPIFVDGKKYIGDPGIHCCDNPSLQMGDCMSGSSLQRYEGKTRDGKPLPHVVWVGFARHDGRDNLWKRDIPDSVQLIGHNKTTGATAFFESGDNSKWVSIDPKTNRMTGVLPGIDDPAGFNRAYSTPHTTQCVECHQSDPFVHNPFIDSARLPGDPFQPVVPKVDGPDTPYYVIGASHWDMRTIHIKDNSCFDCHRIGMRTMEEFIGNGWNPHEHMPPSDPGSMKEDFEELLQAWIKGPENTPNSEWIIPPAGDAPSRVVGDDYPFQADFNQPHMDAIRRLNQKPRRIPETVEK